MVKGLAITAAFFISLATGVVVAQSKSLPTEDWIIELINKGLVATEGFQTYEEVFKEWQSPSFTCYFLLPKTASSSNTEWKWELREHMTDLDQTICNSAVLSYMDRNLAKADQLRKEITDNYNSMDHIGRRVLFRSGFERRYPERLMKSTTYSDVVDSGYSYDAIYDAAKSCSTAECVGLIYLAASLNISIPEYRYINERYHMRGYDELLQYVHRVRYVFGFYDEENLIRSYVSNNQTTDLASKYEEFIALLGEYDPPILRHSVTSMHSSLIDSIFVSASSDGKAEFICGLGNVLSEHYPDKISTPKLVPKSRVSLRESNTYNRMPEHNQHWFYTNSNFSDEKASQFYAYVGERNLSGSNIYKHMIRDSDPTPFLFTVYPHYSGKCFPNPIKDSGLIGSYLHTDRSLYDIPIDTPDLFDLHHLPISKLEFNRVLKDRDQSNFKSKLLGINMQETYISDPLTLNSGEEIIGDGDILLYYQDDQSKTSAWLLGNEKTDGFYLYQNPTLPYLWSTDQLGDGVWWGTGRVYEIISIRSKLFSSQARHSSIGSKADNIFRIIPFPHVYKNSPLSKMLPIDYCHGDCGW